MTWDEVKVGDVVHYNVEGLRGMYTYVDSWSYLVLEVRRIDVDKHVIFKLFNLDTGCVVRDDRDAFMDMPEPIWTVERAEGA